MRAPIEHNAGRCLCRCEPVDARRARGGGALNTPGALVELNPDRASGPVRPLIGVR